MVEFEDMDYALAMELKQAGWSMYVAGRGYVDIGNITPAGFFDNWPPSVCAVPTLEEIIEACGDGFYLTDRNDGKTRFEFRWIAGVAGDTRHSLGTIPIEAVARLWLALNRTEAVKS
jgi:hypothetical protein